jgi:hypothetical protein
MGFWWLSDGNSLDGSSGVTSFVWRKARGDAESAFKGRQCYWEGLRRSPRPGVGAKSELRCPCARGWPIKQAVPGKYSSDPG